MKKMKKNWIVALSCGVLACGVVGAAGLSLNVADANTEQKFEMLSGAAVCIADGVSGIRWTTTVNEAFYNSLPDGAKEFGVLVTPRNNIAAGSELTAASPEVEAIPCENTAVKFTNGEFTYYSSIVYSDLTEEDAQKAYAVELAARAYVKVGETYYYVDEYEACTRSMRSVAYDVYRTNPEYADLVEKYYGTVAKSEVASGYFSEMDGVATLTNVNDLTDGTYKGSVNAQPVSVKVNGSTMTVEGDLYGLTAGEEYQLNVFGDSEENKNDIAAQPFTYATKVIDEASDLSVFYLGDTATVNDTYKTWVNAKSFDGYYVLTKNIDCTDYVHSVATLDALNTVTSFSMTGHNAGLTGVFEGNGYTISNLTLVRRGLFGAIVGGTVQNVAFKNVKFTRGDITNGGGYGGRNVYTLACVIEGATLKNVYVHIPTMQSSYVLNGTSGMSNAGNGNYGAGLADSIDGSTVMENCVIKIDAYDYMTNANYSGGSLMRVVDDTEGAYANVKNVYVISGANLASTTNTINGVNRYATVADMEKEGNDYSSFNNGFWDVVEGKIPQFTTRVDVINVQGTYYLDMSEGKFGTDDMAKMFGSSTVALESVKIGETEYTVEGGKVSGVPVNKDGTPVQMTITLQGSEEVYSVSVIPATKLIDEASDLSVFYLGDTAYAMNVATGGQTIGRANAFDGYYVLTKDIDCTTGYVHSVTPFESNGSWAGLNVSGHSNIGLTGVFEGNGHTISNLSLNRRGLFGAIVGGTVQNVGFENLKFTRDDINGTSLAYHGQDSYALACVIERATLKNVYVHIPTMNITYNGGASTTSAKSAVRGAGLAGSIDGSTVMENCVIKIDEYNYMTNANYSGGSLMHVADNTEGAYADEDIKNVYVISGAVLSSSTDTINGVKRYDSVAKMEEKATDNAESLGTFDSKYWTVVNGVPTWN